MATQPRLTQKEILVRDLVGPDCITSEDGRMLFDLIFPELRKGQRILLNFQGVEVFASPFLNAAIGALLEAFDEQELKSRLKWINVNPDAEPVFRLVIENASQYFKNPSIRNVVSKTLEDFESER